MNIKANLLEHMPKFVENLSKLDAKCLETCTLGDAIETQSGRPCHESRGWEAVTWKCYSALQAWTPGVTWSVTCTPNVLAPRLIYFRCRPVCTGADRSSCEISSPIEILVLSSWPTWSTSGAQHNQNNIYNRRPVCCFIDQFACFSWTSL